MSDTPDNDLVICPNCVHQFRAIPVNVQRELAEAQKEIEAMRQVIDACRMVPRYQLDSFVQSALDKYEASKKR